MPSQFIGDLVHHYEPWKIAMLVNVPLDRAEDGLAIRRSKVGSGSINNVPPLEDSIHGVGGCHETHCDTVNGRDGNLRKTQAGKGGL